MAEFSPSGCFIAIANRVALPVVFFIQIIISAQKQMSLLIHKHLSFADYPSVHASRHKYRTYSCSHPRCSPKLKQKNEGRITISRQQPPQTSFSVGRCTCHSMGETRERCRRAARVSRYILRESTGRAKLGQHKGAR